MIVVGDFFALGLIGILCLFYFRNRYYPSAAARCYAHCLVFAATNATLDIITAYLIVYKIPYCLRRHVPRSAVVSAISR